ncbi:MAG: hypothetical protein CMG66_01610 [Candidatus Marinimicrobia bacterium]|nr:hypothetical protein [Candidatus Neomarinimicrobiota bacterium]|tara:strand:+ start:35186 stop:35869 length:684 start_codon:yes stop_codon:yes gene_type:complete
MKTLYSIGLYCVGTIFMLILAPLMLLVTLVLPSKIYHFAQFISIGLFKCFNIERKIIGSFPSEGTYIIMHNHSSFLDLFFLPTIIKGKYTGIVAAKNFKIPLIGTILKRVGAIPIHRFNHAKAMKALQIAESRIKQGYHIAIFPEGTRTTTGKLSQFKKGGFHMASNTGTKILPIIVKGLYEIKPKHRWQLYPGIATMIILKPIDVMNKSVDELINEVHDLYVQHGL